MRLGLAILLVSTVARAAPPAAPRPTLAVLDPTAEEFPKKEAKIIGEAIRDAVIAANMYRVQDRTAMREILATQKQNASEECDESCAVEQGRLLQVRYLVSSTISRVDETTWISVRLTDVESGEAVSSARDSCACTLSKGMLPLAESVTRRALGAAGGAEKVARALPQDAPIEGKFGDEAQEFAVDSAASVVVPFESTPPGAVVRVDGALLCQSTPCTKEVSLGEHMVVMEKERYEAITARTTVAKGTRVALNLPPTFGWLAVETTPPGLGLSVNGKAEGQSPLPEREVAPGGYEVAVDDPCYARAGERVALKKGERRVVRIEPKQKMAAIKVSAADEKQDALEAEVRIEGRVLGPTPGVFKVPACTKQVEVVAKRGGRWTGPLQLVERETTVVRAVIIAEPVTATFESAPSGAEVLVDGLPLCPATPCTETVQKGDHEIRMRKDRYEPRSLRTALVQGSRVEMDLPPTFATLTVLAGAGRPVLLDGKPGAVGPSATELAPGQYKLDVEGDRCHKGESTTVSLRKGEQREVNMPAVPRMAKIHFTAEDDGGDERTSVEVYADDVRLTGTLPADLDVPICTKKLRMVYASYVPEYVEEVSLSEGEETSVRAVFALGNDHLRYGIGLGLSANALAVPDFAQRSRGMLEVGYDTWSLRATGGLTAALLAARYSHDNDGGGIFVELAGGRAGTNFTGTRLQGALGYRSQMAEGPFLEALGRLSVDPLISFTDVSPSVGVEVGYAWLGSGTLHTPSSDFWEKLTNVQGPASVESQAGGVAGGWRILQYPEGFVDGDTDLIHSGGATLSGPTFVWDAQAYAWFRNTLGVGYLWADDAAPVASFEGQPAPAGATGSLWAFYLEDNLQLRIPMVYGSVELGLGGGFFVVGEHVPQLLDSDGAEYDTSSGTGFTMPLTAGVMIKPVCHWSLHAMAGYVLVSSDETSNHTIYEATLEYSWDPDCYD